MSNAITTKPTFDLSNRCIPFAGKRGKGGYGYTQFMGRQYLAHRLAYALNEFLHPDALRGIVIRHKCDNPECINVEHLEPGTQKDNAEDKVKRGRSLRGEAVATSKLTASMVAEIKASYIPRSRHANQYQLAKRFGVSQAEVSHILAGKRWSYA